MGMSAMGEAAGMSGNSLNFANMLLGGNVGFAITGVGYAAGDAWHF